MGFVLETFSVAHRLHSTVRMTGMMLLLILPGFRDLLRVVCPLTGFQPLIRPCPDVSTSVGLGIAKAGNKQAGITSRYRDTGNEC